MNEYQFTSQFMEIRPDNFTYEGLKALFEYFEQYEEDTGTEIEFDPIAVCCEYSEYKNLAEFQQDYSEDYESVEQIEEQTIIFPVLDSLDNECPFIIACF